VFAILALLLVAVTGAMAQTYTVSVKQGTEDATNWKAKAGDATEFADMPLNVAENQPVTVTYTGSKLVMRVKARKKVADPALPEGALPGKFSVSSARQVYFSKGNLQVECSSVDGTSSPETWTWRLAKHQWDYVGDAVANTSIDGKGSVSVAGTVDLFGWSSAQNIRGIDKSTGNEYQGAFVDWGSDIGTGWRTLSSDEWKYLLNNRSVTYRYCKATVNIVVDSEVKSVTGLVIFPDSYSHPDGVTEVNSPNTTSAAYTTNSWSEDDWTLMETAGVVFLPAAGSSYGLPPKSVGEYGYYWSSSRSTTYNYAYYMNFSGSSMNPAGNGYRCRGSSVRLVYDSAKDMTPGATANTWTLAKMPAFDVEVVAEYFDLTAPTANTADIYVGYSTALVTGGSSINGTLMYKVTAENMKPTSTDDFKDAVTAQDCPTAGTYYVWYYIDGMTVDSPIVDTAVEVTVIDSPKSIVKAMINALPDDPDDVTVADYAAIIAARAAYDALTAQQKSKVADVRAKLAAAEDAMGQVYTVSVKQGTEDATNWTASSNSAAEGQTVTVTYTGTKKVKSVKAKKEVVPEGALPKKFSVSSTKKVYFSKGNLQNQASTKIWRFAEHQYDFVGDASNGNVYVGEVKSNNASISSTYDGWIDLFGWGTSGHQPSGYGANYQPWATEAGHETYWMRYGPTDGTSDLTGDYAEGDWGVNMGTGWRTLTAAEWIWLLGPSESPNPGTNCRTSSTVNGTENVRFCKATVDGNQGLVIFPDNYSHPLSVSSILKANTYEKAYYSACQKWTAKRVD
jgi:DNA-binding protein YbaB